MTLEVVLATEQDVPRLMEIRFAAFDHVVIERLMNGDNTPSNRDAAGRRLIALMQEDSSLSLIKCVFHDPETAEEQIVGCCMVHLYAGKRAEHEWTAEHPFLSTQWSGDQKIQDCVQSLALLLREGRKRMRRPHALLIYLAVDPAYRRRGAGRALVQWALDRCDKLSIPAYLEASEMGYPVYIKAGFHEIDPVIFSCEDGQEEKVKCMLREARKDQ